MKKHGEVLVKQVASIATLGTGLSIRDNGTGATLFAGTGPEVVNSPFGECVFEAVSIKHGVLVLWLHHDEVAKLKGG